MMIDLYLRAGNAGGFARACSWLRGEDEDGSTFWITAGDGFVFDPIGEIVLEPGTTDEDGTELTPPVMSDDFRAILRCREDIAALVPEAMKLDYADAPRKWAGDVAELEIVVPERVTMRQARLALLGAGILDEAEAAIGAMTGTQGRAAQIEWEYATELRRDHPLVAGIGQALGLEEEAIDALFEAASKIV